MIGRVAYTVSARGEAAARSGMEAAATANRAFNTANRQAQEATSYRAVLSAPLEHMRWFYRRPFSFLPVNTFLPFLLGFIALRLGLFDEPERHRRLIATLAVAGVASWAVATWVFPALMPHTGGPLVHDILLNRLQCGFGIVRAFGLSITPLVGLTMAVALFIAQALFSRWWLAHYP